MPLRLIDTHIHGSFGINFNNSDYDGIKFVLSELFKRNVYGICPTLVGDSADNIQKQLSIFKKIKDEQLKDIKSEALILGVHLEGTFLSPNKAGIQDKNVFKKPTVENFKKLVGDFEQMIKIVTIAPEENKDLIEYLIENNIKAQAGHSLAKNLGKCCCATHIFNAMNQIHHREDSLALEALVRDDIYCEIISDLIHVSENMLKLFFKAKPKDKVLLISDSLPSSNFDKDIIFCNKKINKEGKDEFGTLAGSNYTLDVICKNLLEKNILTQEDITQMGFKNQINYLNLLKTEVDILNR
ncbi:hypothetical protein IJ425_00340 [bacterium]|nr:hypothetical protein [bacterium]